MDLLIVKGFENKKIISPVADLINDVTKMVTEHLKATKNAILALFGQEGFSRICKIWDSAYLYKDHIVKVL